MNWTKFWGNCVDLVCSINSGWFKFIALVLIFVPLFCVPFICDNAFSFNTFLGIMLASLGYICAVVLTLIRYKNGIKD